MTPHTRYLSKSQFTRGMQCPKSLWLYREKEELQDPIDADQEAIFDAGTEIGVMARSWLKGGTLIKSDHSDPEAALLETARAIADGAKVLYEAAFLHDDVLVRADIMAQGPGGVWDLYEVKSTTKVEDIYYHDAAIQRYVIEGSGVAFGVAHIVHLNPDYVRRGALDLQQLFVFVDVNAETAKIIPEIPGMLGAMKTTNALEQPPGVAIGPRCKKPHVCSFEGHCWKESGVPEYSVFNLAGARMQKKTDLWNEGVRTIAEIPEHEKLTPYQAVQRRVAMKKRVHIEHGGIRGLLDGLAYPLHFLDFEAVNPAIPPYDGTRPYQQVPFEASVHVRGSRGAALEHFEYLADGTKDPRQELAAFLRTTIGSKGSVVAYNKSYEGGILKGIASAGVGDYKYLLSIEARLWDLADSFRKALYAHPDFKGSWSIKKVLPVLVPAMTYEGMAIADGTAAMRAYARLMTEDVSATERDQTMADLKVYCGQDTLAMVRILDVLEAEVAATMVYPAGPA